jgi:hypothetical protein
VLLRSAPHHYMRSSHWYGYKRRRQSPSASGNRLGAVWTQRHSIWDSTQCKGFRRFIGCRFSHYSILVIQIWPSFTCMYGIMRPFSLFTRSRYHMLCTAITFWYVTRCIVDCTRHAWYLNRLYHGLTMWWLGLCISDLLSTHMRGRQM